MKFSTTSPELTTDGAFDKCWVKEDDIYLIKAGSCTIVEVQPTLQLADEEAYKEIYCVGDLGSKLLTDVEIKRKIKYEKSYLAKKELQRNFGPDMFTHGKHYYGCRRKRRVK